VVSRPVARHCRGSNLVFIPANHSVIGEVAKPGSDDVLQASA
jgi:hypothetical protein